MATDERIVRGPVVVDAWRQAQLAEILWLASDGQPDATAVVPLLDGEVPCLALPYRDLTLARSLAAAEEVVIGVTAAPAVGTGAVLAHGRAELTADPDGVTFQTLGLLEQELHKHPPSRRRLDSLLLRREHWWYVPRLLVRIRGLTSGRLVAPGDALLALGGPSLSVRPCHLDADGAPRRTGDETSGAVDAGTARPATILEHGADLPDLDRPWQRRRYGTFGSEGFVTHATEGHGPIDRPLGLRQRLRAETALARACKRGLRHAADS